MRDLEHARQLLVMAHKDLAALRAMRNREAGAEVASLVEYVAGLSEDAAGSG